MQVFQTAASLAPPVYFVATKSTTNEAANAAEPGAPVAPDKTSSKKGASQKNGPPKAKKVAKGGKAKASKKEAKASKKADKPDRQAKATGPGAESKSAKLLAMIGSAKGAKLAELMKELGWQAHSVRGFISIAGKKGTKIEFSKNEAGERVYKSTK